MTLMLCRIQDDTHSAEMSDGKLSTRTVTSRPHCKYVCNANELSSYDSVLLTLDIKITK